MITRTFFPTIQKKVASGDMTDVEDLFYKQLRISFCFGLVIYVALTFYSEPFIRLWMFQEGFDMNSVAQASMVMSILALSKFPSLYLFPCQSILAAMGHVRFNAARVTSEAIVNVILSLFFVTILHWGLAGVAAGTLAARILVATITVPVFLFKNSPFSGRAFLKAVIFPAIISMATISLICHLMVTNYPPTTWVAFSGHIFAILFIWCLISFAFLLPANTRKSLLGMLRSN
jgi:O-antigen/teichoic acid export membrane protein